MSNVSQWSPTAASNNSASPNGWPESMPPAGVNDSARENMAAVARMYADQKGAITSGGSSNAYTVTTNSSHAALADIGVFIFIANHTNTGAATLAVDGLAAKAIEVRGSAVSSGDIIANGTYIAVYNSTGDAFEIFGVPQADVARDNAVTSYSGAQYFAPTSVTSTSNSVAINMNTNQFCKHTLTENTTIAAPTNAAEGMQLVITVTQHASAAKTLAWNSVFKGTIPAMSTTTGAKMVFAFYCYDGTNFVFTGSSGEIT